MDEERYRKMREKVQAELIGCVKLASLPLSKKVSREIVEDRIRLFEFFKSHGLVKELELNETLLRLLMNYVKMASYHGVLKGFEIERQAAALRKDKARYHLLVFLKKNPDATNQQLIRHLDRKNGLLAEHNTSPSDSQWAPLPPSLRRAFKKQGLKQYNGEYWETALKEFPEPVMQYLARIRSAAKKVKVKNVLFNWPDIVYRHKRERKK
jgi:hypothetical protein